MLCVAIAVAVGLAAVVEDLEIRGCNSALVGGTVTSRHQSVTYDEASHTLEGFLNNAPDWLATWTGIRIDSGDPAQGAETAINWWVSKGQDPRDKLVIFSDGLDVAEMLSLQRRFASRVKVSFGWGTNLTNDFRGLVPDRGLGAFSLVCKAVSANGNPTVKLSDNPNKAVGPDDEIARYKRVFDVTGQTPLKVMV